MRHQKAGAKLGRTSSHRNAMFRNMVTSLFKHDRIRTTEAKAKAVRGWADHVITLAKRGDLHARRQVLSIIREKAVAHKLFEEASERFGGISGGYTRVLRIGRRFGDAATISLVELVSATGAGTKPKKTAPKPTVTATPPPTSVESAPSTAEAPQTETSVEEAPEPEETIAPEAREATPETPAQAETARPESEEPTPSEESTGEEPEDTESRKDE